MADYIATIASQFRVNNLQEFLAEPAIVGLKAAFEDSEDYGEGESGHFHTQALEGGGGHVNFGGHRGIPDPDETAGIDWKAVIQKHLSPGAFVRISMAGFDEAFKYTVACAYDITPERISTVDASYGSLLGNEWFHSLPEADQNPFKTASESNPKP